MKKKRIYEKYKIANHSLILELRFLTSFLVYSKLKFNSSTLAIVASYNSVVTILLFGYI